MAYTPGQQQAGYQTNGFDPSVLPQGSNPDALTIDQVNIAMRNSPVWNNWMSKNGINPASVHLGGGQKDQLREALGKAGFPLPEGWEIDNSGNIREETHVGRNIMIAAAIAGAAFGGWALLSAYGGAAAGGAGGAAAATGGVEAGAVAGIDASIAAGTIGTAGALTSTGALVGLTSASGAAATAASVAAEGGAFAADGTFVGASTITGEVGAAGTTAATGAAGTGASTLSRIGQAGQAARAIGGAIGNATDAAQESRRRDTEQGFSANRENIQGQSAFEAQLMARENAEAKERQQNLRDVYRSSIARNPNRSPFNATAGPKYSDAYLSTLSDLESQGTQRLRTGPTYSTNQMPAVRPYTPIDPRDVEGSLGTGPGTLERIGQYVGPALSTYSTLASIYGRGR